ncbi:MAG: cation:proton antiporter [Pseudomonadota bacterium]
MEEHHITFALVAIVALGVGAQWIAWRLRLPAIVILAAVGLAAGQLHLVDPSGTFGAGLPPIVSLCVAVILFEGGLNLHFRELKASAVGVRRLVYAGAPLAWLFSSLAAFYVGGLSLAVSLVFGAIMVVTGPTVIMPMLRQASLNRKTASYFKWEGIVNDPIGALLAVLVFQFFVYKGQGSGLSTVFTGLAIALLSGGFLGGLGGWLTGKAFQASLVPEYLKSPVMLGLVLVVFTVSNSVQHEAGLLAVTVMGIVIGNMHLAGIQDMKRFKEYITVMLVAVVFILLTADLDLAVIAELDWRGIMLVVAVLFVVRPATIMLATVRSGMELNDRLILSWIAPRGIVAAATAGVMGPRLISAGYEDANQLLPLVFMVIFATVVLHGMSIGWLARRLDLASKVRDSVLIVGASPWTIELARKLSEMKINTILVDSSWHNLRPARLAGLSTFYVEILSDFAEESVEIGHVGTVLAATSNDAYNALVCTAMAPEIGRGQVFQLPMGAGSEEDDRVGMARPLRGQFAFSNDAVFEKLWQRHVREWKFYRTRISESYSYSDFLGDCPQDAIQIMTIKPDGAPRLRAVDAKREPDVGDTILYYAPSRERSQGDANAKQPAAKNTASKLPGGKPKSA